MKILKCFQKSANLSSKAILKAFFPARCLSCRSFFHVPPNFIENIFSKPSIIDEETNNLEFLFDKIMAGHLCKACLKEFACIDSPKCPKCGIVFKSREGEDHMCGECVNEPKKFGFARALGVYDKTLMSLIHRFKYEGKIQLAKPLSLLLFKVFLLNWRKREIDVVMPVPLHSKRLKQRGFNQAFMLIRYWPEFDELLIANSFGLSFNIDFKSLMRTRWTKSQTGLNKKQRMENIKNAFGIADPEKIISKYILLVDDVFTTGATLNECAQTLIRAGAKQVDVLTLARAV